MELEEIFGEVIEPLVKKELLISDAEGIRLTRHGMQYGNVVFREFLLT